MVNCAAMKSVNCQIDWDVNCVANCLIGCDLLRNHFDLSVSLNYLMTVNFVENCPNGCGLLLNYFDSSVSVNFAMTVNCVGNFLNSVLRNHFDTSVSMNSLIGLLLSVYYVDVVNCDAMVKEASEILNIDKVSCAPVMYLTNQILMLT